MAMISVENVSLTIGTAQILRDISVSFEEGQIHGIIGRNGSGKTMLMKCICGFIRPTAGRIIVDGNQGKTILLSSHNREDIDLLCDSVCKMAGGVLTRLKVIRCSVQ